MFDIVRVEDGTFKLSGRLDASQVDLAQEALAEIRQSVSLDCSELDYISSAGLAVVFELFKRLRADGQTLRLLGVPPRIRSVLVYAKLDALLGVE